MLYKWLLASLFVMHQMDANPRYLKHIIQDTKVVVTAPTRWDKSDLALAGLVVAGTAGLMAIDQPISNILTRNKIDPVHSVLSIADKFGYENYTIPTLMCAYFVGELLGSHETRKIALLSMESFLLAGGATSIGKYLLHRQRPRSKNSSPFRFSGPSLKTNRVSFPSGHTACAFAIAAVVAEEFKDDSILFPIAAYSLASLTGIARIERKDHWASDVFFGACIGLTVGKCVAKLHPERILNEDWNVYISPNQMALGHSF